MAKFDVSGIAVYGLNESMAASGFPMQHKIELNVDEGLTFREFQEIVRRCDSLALTPSGQGHDCFLKGIVVQANITAPIYWFAQFDRYHFQDTVSSQSTMHRILKMNIKEQCNEYTHDGVIEITEMLINEYNSMLEQGAPQQDLRLQFQRIISSSPRGLCLTRRITTNYLQLKSMYHQRKNHKLIEWSQFLDVLFKEIPYTHWITGKKVPSMEGSNTSGTGYKPKE